MPKKKTKTISQLKKELDKVFSIFIRTRNADWEGNEFCFTCKRKMHWKNLHAGHFQSRSKHSIRWDYELGNVMPQCPKCNIWESGQQYKFGVYLDQQFGDGRAALLEQMGNQIVKYTKQDYEEKIKYFKQQNRINGY